MSRSIDLVNNHIGIEVVDNGYVVNVCPPAVRTKDTPKLYRQVCLSDKELLQAIRDGVQQVIQSITDRQEHYSQNGNQHTQGGE